MTVLQSRSIQKNCLFCGTPFRVAAILPCFFPILRFNSHHAHSVFLSACLCGCYQARTHSSPFNEVKRSVQSNNLTTRRQILHAARGVVLALAAHTFALAALAQSPLPDSLNPEADGIVRSLAEQVDGKLLVGGEFTTLGGQSRIDIGRLNADGTLDTSFNPGANGPAFSLAV